MRTEFGYERSVCGCRDCQINCRYIPGFLVPADLQRLIPRDVDALKWAEEHLLASPGAVVAKGMELFRIPTLAPAVKSDGTCHWLAGGKKNGRCTVHENAPYGCAFFDCKPVSYNDRATSGLVAIANESSDDLYKRIWQHLWNSGKRQFAPEILRERMEAEL